jgi:signal transduction histidine kinase
MLMSILTAMLQNFIEIVPICLPSTRLSAVRLIFRQEKCDRLAVVNELGQPLGLVSLSHLLQKGRISQRRVKDQGELLSTVKPTIISPLSLVSGDLSLSEFWLWLQEEEATAFLPSQEKNTQFNDLAGKSENWSRHSQAQGILSGAIADFPNTANTSLLPAPNSAPIALIESSSGKFLGLLDSIRLLKFMAIEGIQKKEVGVKNQKQERGKREEGRRNLAVANYQLPTTNYQLPVTNSFVQLLEQLPLPLRLLGADGQIITSNAVWKTLLGDEPELTAIATPTTNISPPPFSYRDTGNSLMAGTPTPESSSRIPLRRTQAWEEKIVGPISAIALEEKKSLTSSIPSYCVLSTAPDIYTCTSPTHQGNDRLWQFIKQPISETLILVLAQDVTEEQLVAKELIAKNTDLIQLNRLKDEFLACISHELKTPLTAVLGLSSLLKDHAIGELNDRQTRYAKLIHASGRHLMTVVNDILDLTRIETGQMELSVAPVQIATVCDRAFEGASLLQQQEDKPPNNSDISGTEPKSKIDFTLEIEPGLVHIVADELRLRQMLVNLLSNALKFTAEGGKIGLKVNHWEGWIAFTVSDTGIGIPADKQHLIFQKFQQLESPMTRRFQGTGLGLVLTQRLARLHEGDVSFISSEGQGSQFTLLLPPCSATYREPGKGQTEISTVPLSPCEPLPPRPFPRLVLIVETVPQFIEDLTNLLKGLDYRVLIARSGTEALEKARRFRPEVIFLNPLLPLLSGWDVLTLLKNDPETSSIPVIITATRGEKERATLNRAEGFLSLPVKESALVGQLKRLTQPPQPNVELPKNSLTVLLLSPLNTSFHAASFLIHPSYCRVLEADDLDQAELLARIWHPNVMVLESVSQFEDPLAFMEELSQRSSLTTIPLVTLDPITTQLANQVKGLSVFPCLAPSDRCHAEEPMTSGMIASALWQVIQAAIGIYSSRHDG